MEYVVATEWELARQGGQLILDHKQGGKAVNKDQVMSKEYFDRINANTQSNGRICVENKTKTKEWQKAKEEKVKLRQEAKLQASTLNQGNLAMDIINNIAAQAIARKEGENDK